MRNKLRTISICLLLIMYAALQATISQAYATSQVSIQSRIDTAKIGDTIIIPTGVYNESVHITTDGLTIRCEQLLKCTAKNFEIWASNVTLDGFKLVGGKSFGVEVRYHNNTVKNVDISGVLYDFGLPRGQGATVGISFFGTGHVFDGIYIHDLNQYHVDDLGYTEPHQDCFISWHNAERGGSGAFITINNVLCDMPQIGDSYVSKIFSSSGGSHDWTITNLVGITPLACLFYDEAYNINISHSTLIGAGHPTPQGCKFLKLNASKPAPHNNTITTTIFQNITGTPAMYDYVTGHDNCFWQVANHKPDPGDIFSNPLLTSDWSVPTNSPCSKMGAKLTLFSSPPPSTTPSPTPKPGDLNGDGSVNLLDFNQLIKKFGNPYTILDFNAIVANFGKTR